MKRHILSLVVMGATVLRFAMPAHAGATSEGALAIVSADDEHVSLTGGDETTLYTVRLPDGASCPGDTVHDAWQIDAFIIPTDDDPAALVYTGLGPSDREIGGEIRRLALYHRERNPYGVENLPRNPIAGQPAKIPTPPVLSFAQPATIGLAPGRYQIGVGCSFDGDLRMYWSATVTIARPAGNKDVRLTWSVEAAAVAPSAPDDSTSSVTIVLVAGVALVVVVLVVRIARRRASRARPN